jgi:hypothetical protein
MAPAVLAMNAKLPCSCGSLIPAGKCCERQAHQMLPPRVLRERERSKKLGDVKKQKPHGFPITVAQLRHADEHKRTLARLLRFLWTRIPEVAWVTSYEQLAGILNEGVTGWKRTHIAVNRK